jgi:hypothetical protein
MRSCQVTMPRQLLGRPRVKLCGWRDSLVFSRACWVLLLLACLSLAASAKATLPGWFSNEIDASDYDCTLTLTPARGLAKTSAVHLSLEWGNGKSHTQVTITRTAIALSTVTHRAPKLLATIDAASEPGAQSRLIFMRRGGWIAVQRDGKVLGRCAVPRTDGTHAGVTADDGWTVDASTIQRLEPVVFADDFMRTADDPGLWKASRGQWAIKTSWDNAPHGILPRFANARYAQNPFAWGGHAGKDAYALCAVGEPFWEDYTVSVSMRPTLDGAAGVMVNMTDASHGLLVRWSSVADRQKQRGNALVLYRMADGALTELARDAGGYLPGQWYRLTVSTSLDGLTVGVDGRERIAVKNITPWRGGVGLYCEGAADTVFDDVTVYGHAVNTDLLLESRQSRVGAQFTDDPNGMKEWAVTIDDWIANPTLPGHCWYRWGVYGENQWMALTLRPVGQTAGELTLALNGTDQDPDAGYRAVLRTTAASHKLTCVLYRGTTELAKGTGEALAPDTSCLVRFKRLGSKLQLMIDGEDIVTATDEKPLSGARASYRATGSLSGVREAQVLSRNELDYNFTDAPTDWLEEGTWVSTIRWSCSPSWSFLGGWSRGDAALWHKQCFRGDQELQAFVGLKMEYPREQDFYENRYRDFAITICGDGRDPRVGYAGIYGAPDEAGVPNQRTVLLRNGVVVASNTMAAAGKSANHRNWFDLQLRKHGSVVEFWVEGQRQFTFTDPDPLEEGIPAIWTTNNGISLARARMRFANPPTPRTDAQVVIDDPWYPEWANLGQPQTLDFPHSWSSANGPVTLAAAKRLAPAGPEPEVRVAEKKVTFTPKTVGDYWYQINACDRGERSEPFHLFFPAFNPALGRDDTRALVLYRFDEGRGFTIRDQSKVTPAADLTIAETPDAPAADNWLPGQGLTLHGAVPVKTAGAVKKLMALAEKKAGTVEWWLSTDTIYPPSGWAACLLSWVTDANESNLSIGHYFSGAPGNIIVIPQGSAFDLRDPNTLQAPGFRTGLQHIVVTWDGTTTHAYINGKHVGERNLPWNPERWKADGLLVLGNTGDSTRGYRGTFYLLAIHDRCLPDKDVQRHYAAGPSAR